MVCMPKSRLSHYKQNRLLKHFVAGTTARTSASLCGITRRTAAFESSDGQCSRRAPDHIGLQLG